MTLAHPEIAPASRHLPLALTTREESPAAAPKKALRSRAPRLFFIRGTESPFSALLIPVKNALPTAPISLTENSSNAAHFLHGAQDQSMPSHLRAALLLQTTAALLLCQSPPGQADLTKAYDALKTRDYDLAIELFHKGIALQPANPGLHKDLAYTLLKTGDNAAARDEFAAAQKLNPLDETAALEFAFLAFETKQPIQARRMFDKLRQTGSPATRQTAEQAFQNIDKPLATSIARWQQAIAQSPKPNDLTMFSAHWELAQTAELRDELPLAAKEYEICRQLKPQMAELLLHLARVYAQINRGEEAQAALLAASRSSESRTAEQALEIYGTRYPYPYEFLNALKLDPHNAALRRELVYLYLAMNEKPKAIEQLEAILSANPKDFAAREQLDALRGFKTRPQYIPHDAAPSASATSAKAMGLKSLALGYNNDAIKYLLQALEEDPKDSAAMLKLGWAYNAAKRDAEAKIWFDRARHAGAQRAGSCRETESGIRAASTGPSCASSPEDRQIAAEANKAFHTLNGDVTPQTTIWALPMYSSRWNDIFTYGQIKRSIPIPGLGHFNKLVSFYVSTRFTGDAKTGFTTQNVAYPENLSQSSFIFGIGASSKTWRHLTGWVEAGESVKYLNLKNVGAAVPDYRGGLNFAKGFGSLLASNKAGFYYETTGDAIYVSSFGKDWLFYSQNRAGRTIPIGEGNKLQLLLNGNLVQDEQRQPWANIFEYGPGLRFHPHFFPANVYFSTDFLLGIRLLEQWDPLKNGAKNPYYPAYYNDIRIGFWYALTK
jgi:thioredoxin-like negative regulator of GroEL